MPVSAPTAGSATMPPKPGTGVAGMRAASVAGTGRRSEVKRQTAVRHLAEIADAATDLLRLSGTEIGWPVEELWAGGDLLDDGLEIEDSAVIMVLDVPTDELPWLARHRAGEWAGERLRLPKRPFRWAYRPTGWPAWNHQNRRVVRFWTASTGVDHTVIDALRKAHRGLNAVEPSRERLAGQLRSEQQVSRRHLRQTLDQYWDRDWRRGHKGYGETPEDHLWRAAAAVSEIQDAIDELGG